MSEVRVLIAADNLLSRVGLAALLSSQPDSTVVGQISDAALSGDELTAELDLYRPDVLVYDLGWNPTPAIERLTALMAALNGDLPVLALLPDDDQAGNAAAAFKSRTAGGLLLRDSNPETLTLALHAICAGLLVIDPALSGAILPTGDASAAGTELPPEALTPREREVLQLLSEGLPNKTIASRLNISEHTVKFHVNALLSKLDAQSRTEAVVRATRLGLIIL